VHGPVSITLFIMGDNTGSVAKAINRQLLYFTEMVSVNLFSNADAVHVAEVNNLSFRDKNKTGFNMNISPCLGIPGFKTVSAGLSLKMEFLKVVNIMSRFIFLIILLT
jgi:hypothetical protein